MFLLNFEMVRIVPINTGEVINTVFDFFYMELKGNYRNRDNSKECFGIIERKPFFFFLNWKYFPIFDLIKICKASAMHRKGSLYSTLQNFSCIYLLLSNILAAYKFAFSSLDIQVSFCYRHTKSLRHELLAKSQIMQTKVIILWSSLWDSNPSRWLSLRYTKWEHDTWFITVLY